MSARAGPGRRQGDRRAAVTRAVVISLLAAAVPLSASADVFTRRGKGGVLEATNLTGGEGFQLAYRSKGPVMHSPEFRIRPSNNRLYDAYIQEAAWRHGVDEALVRAVIQVESEFDARAVSRAGARGLMQIMPATAVRLGVSDAFDPRQNILGGVKYLRILLNMFQGDVSLAVAGYNAGENAVVRYNGIPPYKETQNYVRKIQSLLASGFRAYTSRSTVRVAGATPASSFAPDVPRSARKAAKAEKIMPARPRVYYRFVDGRGVLSVSHDPPPEGVTYSLIRALDY